MSSVLVIGLGEIGRPIYELLLESGYRTYGYDVSPSRTINKLSEIPEGIAFLHICYPYNKEFIKITLRYVRRFKPKYVIIHSTIAPGTTREIHKTSKVPTAYSPVRGKHPKIKEHLKFWTKWVSVLPKEEVTSVKKHLESIGLKVRVTDKPETLEIAKLWETVYRALMIAGWQEIHRVARKFNADIVGIAEFIAEVHEVLRDRPIYYPDYIGGHCLIPNTEILNNVYSSKAWQFILESNKNRSEEIMDASVRSEIEAMRKIWSKYTNKEYYK